MVAASGHLSWDGSQLPEPRLPRASSEPGEAYQSRASVQVAVIPGAAGWVGVDSGRVHSGGVSS